MRKSITFEFSDGTQFKATTSELLRSGCFIFSQPFSTEELSVSDKNNLQALLTFGDEELEEFLEGDQVLIKAKFVNRLTQLALIKSPSKELQAVREGLLQTINEDYLSIINI